jgi:glycerophosphoryl diester phosphodiesterase
MARAIAWLVLGVVGAGLAPAGPAAAEDARSAATRPLILGHRGLAWNHPDNPLPANTLRSVQAALAVGRDGVEIDVYRTVDGVIVLRHDDELSHAPGGERPRSSCRGRVTRSRWADIEHCQAHPFDDDGEVAPLTRLEEILALEGLGTLIIDVKNDQDGIDSRATVAAILTLLRDHGRSGNAILMLYRAETVASVREPAVRTCLKWSSGRGRTVGGIVAATRSSRAWGACLSSTMADPPLVEALRREQLAVVTFILGHDRGDAFVRFMRGAERMGIHSVITDQAGIGGPDPRGELAGAAH